MAIVGAGPIGLEMALAFRRLGTDVVLLEAQQEIAPGVLPEAAGILHDALDLGRWLGGRLDSVRARASRRLRDS